MDIMEHEPYAFIQNYSAKNQLSFVHRTFNAIDLDFFFRSLQNLYKKGGLETAFSKHPEILGTKGRIIQFREQFMSVPHDVRSEKHI